MNVIVSKAAQPLPGGSTAIKGCSSTYAPVGVEVPPGCGRRSAWEGRPVREVLACLLLAPVAALAQTMGPTPLDEWAAGLSDAQLALLSLLSISTLLGLAGWALYLLFLAFRMTFQKD